MSNPGDPEGVLLRVKAGKHSATCLLRTARNASVKSAIDVLRTPAVFREASRAIVSQAEHRTCRGLALSEAYFLEQVVLAADARPV